MFWRPFENWHFFFQAEAGIRDGHVTGVQTCALPICNRLYQNDRRRRSRQCGLHCTGSNRRLRSEERRVGKEWRCGWSSDLGRRKNDMNARRRGRKQKNDAAVRDLLGRGGGGRLWDGG